MRRGGVEWGSVGKWGRRWTEGDTGSTCVYQNPDTFCLPYHCHYMPWINAGANMVVVNAFPGESK